MATEKQIAANQLNALKSTGPRSEGGKEASSKNAVKHGLTARKSVVLEDENEEEFAALRQSLRQHYTSRSPVSAVLVDALAAHLWRLQRVPKFEAMLLQSEARQDEPEGSEPEHAVRQLLALREFMLPKDVLGKISRHEAHLLREVHRLMTVLEAMKDVAAEPVAPPEPARPATLPQPAAHAAMQAPVGDYERILNSMSQSRLVR